MVNLESESKPTIYGTTYDLKRALILSAPLAALAGNGANTPDPAAPNVAIPPIVVKAVATDFDINCRRESPPSLSTSLLLFDDAVWSAIDAFDEDGAVVVNPSTDDANKNDENKREEIFMI